MKILVINGSPKGKYSITLQTCNYLQILHPEHEFEILHAGQSIKALEKDFSPPSLRWSGRTINSTNPMASMTSPRSSGRG